MKYETEYSYEENENEKEKKQDLGKLGKLPELGEPTKGIGESNVWSKVQLAGELEGKSDFEKHKVKSKREFYDKRYSVRHLWDEAEQEKLERKYWEQNAKYAAQGFTDLAGNPIGKLPEKYKDLNIVQYDYNTGEYFDSFGKRWTPGQQQSVEKAENEKLKSMMKSTETMAGKLGKPGYVQQYGTEIRPTEIGPSLGRQLGLDYDREQILEKYLRGGSGSDDEELEKLRGFQEWQRGQQQRAMGELWRRATEEREDKSIAEAEADRMREQALRDIALQASMRTGRYDPAIARGVTYAQADVERDIASEAMLARLKEDESRRRYQTDVLGTFLEASLAGRTADTQQFLAEQKRSQDIVSNMLNLKEFQTKEDLARAAMALDEKFKNRTLDMNEFQYAKDFLLRQASIRAGISAEQRRQDMAMVNSILGAAGSTLQTVGSWFARPQGGK